MMVDVNSHLVHEQGPKGIRVSPGGQTAYLATQLPKSYRCYHDRQQKETSHMLQVDGYVVERVSVIAKLTRCFSR